MSESYSWKLILSTRLRKRASGAKCTLSKLIQDKLNHVDTWSRRNRRRYITCSLHLCQRRGESLREKSCLRKWTRYALWAAAKISLLLFPPAFRRGTTSSPRATLVCHRIAITTATLLRTVVVLVRKINYLTNNRSHGVLYVLVVNFTSKQFTGRSIVHPTTALFANSIKPPRSSSDILEEGCCVWFYDGQNLSGWTMRGNVRASAVRIAGGNKYSDYITTHFGGS